MNFIGQDETYILVFVHHCRRSRNTFCRNGL